MNPRGRILQGNQKDFNRGESLEHLRRALKNYGIDVTEEMINQVFEMVTRFPCLSEKK